MSFRVRADRSGREPLERVELLDGRGRTLSRMTLVVRRVFLAGRPVRAAGVGGVYTEKRWRGKGFMTRVMLAGLERCRARRFPLSVLFGIPDFYDRFGFATVMFREPDLRLSPGRRPRRGLDLRVRPLRRTDRGKLLAVYRDCVAGRTGACARGASWPGFAPRGWRRVDRAVIAGRAGRAAGYAAVKIEKEAVHLLEVEGRTPQAREALVAWALRLAERLGREYVSVHVMPGHPAGELLRRLGGEVHLAAQRAGGPMARVVDQGRLLEALAPGLAARLGAAGMRPRGAAWPCAPTSARTPSGRGAAGWPWSRAPRAGRRSWRWTSHGWPSWPSATAPPRNWSRPARPALLGAPAGRWPPCSSARRGTCPGRITSRSV